MASDYRVSALERAFELARSGTIRDISQIKGALVREGYDTGQIEGPMLVRQLRALIRSSAQPA
jgi:hypothetical protein